MNNILRQYQTDNKKIITKYMTKTKNLSPEFRKLKSIIRSNLEDDDIFKDSKHKTEEKTQKQKYEPGIIKRNRIKCYRELNPDLLKEEERKRRNRLIEQRMKEKKKINLKKLEKFFKRNEEELLENIKKLEQKKLIPVKDTETGSIDSESIQDKKNKKNLPYNVKQLYIYGNNFTNNIQNNNINKYLFAYHKKDRWICFPYSDCVIVDKFIKEENNNINNDLIKSQTILNQHKNKSYIYSIKISPHGNVVYFINEEKYIIFYRYDYQKKNFEYLSELLIDYKDKICEYIIEQNEIFCLVLYDNSYIIVIDFFSNEEVLNTKIDYLEQNPFYEMILNNFTEYKIEFCFCSNYSYKIYNLQYIDDIKIKETRHYMKFNNEKKIKSLEFLPVIGLTATLCLLISFEDKSVCLVNGDLNEIIYEYKYNDLVNKIICSLFFINLIFDNKIVFFPLANTKNISVNDMKELKHDIFHENIRKEIKHESKIIYTEIDIYDSTGRALLLTERGFLYYDYYPEKQKIKLYGFNSEEKYITNCVIINNFSNNISEIKKLSHYIITSHKGGSIKISSIPSFDVIYEFREKNVEINYMIGVPGKSLFLVFYNNGLMKCFDIKKCKFTGIINILDIIGNEENKINNIKYAKFYPGGKVCLIVDEARNNLYLITFDSFDPLVIKCKQIPYINIKGLVNIYINRVEPFNTFSVSNNFGEIFIYERKYAALIQSLNLENDTPIYERKDYLNMSKINLAELKLEENKSNLLQNNNKTEQNEIYYGLRIKDIEKEKHYLYIFNYKNNALYVRDTKNKIFVDAIQFNMPIYSLKFENNIQDNIIIMDKNGIQHIKISDLTYGKIKHRGIEWLPRIKSKKNEEGENESKVFLSDEEKMILVINHNGFGVYIITES